MIITPHDIIISLFSGSIVILLMCSGKRSQIEAIMPSRFQINRSLKWTDRDITLKTFGMLISSSATFRLKKTARCEPVSIIVDTVK